MLSYLIVGVFCFVVGWIIRHLLSPTCGTTSRKSRTTDPTLGEAQTHRWFKLDGKPMRMTVGQIAEAQRTAASNLRDNPFAR